MKRSKWKKVWDGRGFTLSETLVAISLSSILAGVAIPATGKLMESYRLSNAVKQVSSEISKTRMQAIGQRQFVRLILQGNGTYVRYRSADGISFSMDGPVQSLPEGVVVSVGATGSPLFDRQGLAPTGSVITLSNDAGQKTITMNVLGRIATS